MSKNLNSGDDLLLFLSCKALSVPGLNETLRCHDNITYLQRTLSPYCIFNFSVLKALTTSNSGEHNIEHVSRPSESKSLFAYFPKSWCLDDVRVSAKHLNATGISVYCNRLLKFSQELNLMSIYC